MNGESQIPAGDLRFLKMHGLGNDFVVIDARGGRAAPPDPALVRTIGHRHFGVGFDQLAVMEDDASAAAAIRFFNSDGSASAACGNATRCVARLLMEESGLSALDLRTERGLLRAARTDDGLVTVNMGQPELAWDRIPLARDIPSDPLPLPGGPAAVGMGNPHCIFFVSDAEAVSIVSEGARFERDPLFPEGTNVEFVEVLDRTTLRMRVWERGGMVTLACGSGACAAAVAAARRGLTDRAVTVRLDGGELRIDWRDDGVWMAGPTALVFDGVLSREILESA